MSLRLVFLLLVFLRGGLDCFSQDTTYARQVINILTSEKFHGRGYVRRGDRKAARYLADEFRKIGLQPSGEKGFYQTFEFPVNRFPGRVEVKINGIELRPGIDFIIDPSSTGGKGRYTLTRYGDLENNETSVTAGRRWILADTLDLEKETADAALRKLRSTEAGVVFSARQKANLGGQ